MHACVGFNIGWHTRARTHTHSHTHTHTLQVEPRMPPVIWRIPFASWAFNKLVPAEDDDQVGVTGKARLCSIYKKENFRRNLDRSNDGVFGARNGTQTHCTHYHRCT